MKFLVLPTHPKNFVSSSGSPCFDYHFVPGITYNLIANRETKDPRFHRLEEFRLNIEPETSQELTIAPHSIRIGCFPYLARYVLQSDHLHQNTTGSILSNPYRYSPDKSVYCVPPVF